MRRGAPIGRPARFLFHIPADFDATVGVNVFNVFNDQSALDFDEIGDVAEGQRNLTYGQPLTYDTPRSVRVQFRVGF